MLEGLTGVGKKLATSSWQLAKLQLANPNGFGDQ